MKTRLLTLFLMSSCLLHAAARAEGDTSPATQPNADATGETAATDAPAASAATAAPSPAPTAAPFTANIGLVSDYRFRGISQTWKRPAVQGGFDYADASGWYLGVWGSNVSGNSYNNGAGLEMDLYGGFKTAVAEGLTLDLGALAYVYPGARMNRAPGVPGGDHYDNVDLYAALTAGNFSGKLSVAATDYFGLDGTTAGYAYFSALTPAGNSKGSAYLDLNYGFDLGQGLTASAHLGHLWVRHYGDLSYTDWKLSLSKPIERLGGLTLSASLVGTDADKAFYQAGDAGGLRPKRLGNTGVVLGISRSF
ncbi:TorF family putative porin [Roseateles sp. SL47]|uniref:TorF family putative porin n=1 Tax=Roseateles sp. SL47 TaxID=2995138 RepID=UPI00227144AB|nr:TorF family putative porin [Roseateles sp. SL47]WAC71350.1 TorF family putative porin [Roseateles sp. SL47]